MFVPQAVMGPSTTPRTSNPSTLLSASESVISPVRSVAPEADGSDAVPSAPPRLATIASWPADVAGGPPSGAPPPAGADDDSPLGRAATGATVVLVVLVVLVLLVVDVLVVRLGDVVVVAWATGR